MSLSAPQNHDFIDPRLEHIYVMQINDGLAIDARFERIVAAQPYPLLFATISGAHLYGFPSPDSDYDLRGAHILPLKCVLGLDSRDETIEDSRVIEGLEMDIVSHDVKKFFGLLLKKNGYVLEQLYSPLKLEDADVAFHETEYQRLRVDLQTAHQSSALPEAPTEGARARLNDLLIRVRSGS